MQIREVIAQVTSFLCVFFFGRCFCFANNVYQLKKIDNGKK